MHIHVHVHVVKREIPVIQHFILFGLQLYEMNMYNVHDLHNFSVLPKALSA